MGGLAKSGGQAAVESPRNTLTRLPKVLPMRIITPLEIMLRI